MLAAGASRRLGRPKQLLQYNNSSLLDHSIKIACDALPDKVLIVLGANAEIISSEIDQEKIHIAINTEWEEGMASSIRCGLNALLKMEPSSEGVVLMVCDQPYVTSELLNNLLTAHKDTGKPIVTCTYEDTFGPPSFFHQSLFGELLQLKGNTGARKIIQLHANDVATIPFPQGSIDIDTQSDYDKIIDQKPA